MDTRKYVLLPENQSIRGLFTQCGAKKVAPKYQVPDYQRSYEWKSPQITALIASIKTAANVGDDMYFAGMIVVAETSEGSDTESSFDIVDGQQRVTTFILLLVCYSHILRKWIQQLTDNDKEKDDEVGRTLATLQQEKEKLGSENERILGVQKKCLVKEDMVGMRTAIDQLTANAEEMQKCDKHIQDIRDLPLQKNTDKIKRLTDFADGVKKLLTTEGGDNIFALQPRQGHTFRSALQATIDGKQFDEDLIQKPDTPTGEYETNIVADAIICILYELQKLKGTAADGLHMKIMPQVAESKENDEFSLDDDDDYLIKFMDYVQHRTHVITTVVNDASAAKVFQGLNRNRGLMVRDSDTLITSIFQGVQAIPKNGRGTRATDPKPSQALKAFSTARYTVDKAAKTVTKEKERNKKLCFPAKFPQDDGRVLEDTDYRDVFGEFLWHLQTISMRGDIKPAKQKSLLEYFTFEGAAIAIPNPDPKAGTTAHCVTSRPIEFVTWIGGEAGDASWAKAFASMLDEETAWNYIRGCGTPEDMLRQRFMRALRNLFLIPHAEWRAAALCAMCVTKSMSTKSSDKYTPWIRDLGIFLQQLECLALVLAFEEIKYDKRHLKRKMEERRQRYGDLTKTILDGVSGDTNFCLTKIQILTGEEENKLRAALHSDIYDRYNGSRLALVVLAIVETCEYDKTHERHKKSTWADPDVHTDVPPVKAKEKDLLVSYLEKTCKDDEVQVEHIAPKAMSKSRHIDQWRDNDKWLELHPSRHCSQLEHWKHKLGNLTLWEGRLNRRASNDHFSEKKPHYNVSSHRLTSMSLKETTQWTPEACAKRDAALLFALASRWAFLQNTGCENFLKRGEAAPSPTVADGSSTPTPPREDDYGPDTTKIAILYIVRKSASSEVEALWDDSDDITYPDRFGARQFEYETDEEKENERKRILKTAREEHRPVVAEPKPKQKASNGGGGGHMQVKASVASGARTQVTTEINSAERAALCVWRDKGRKRLPVKKVIEYLRGYVEKPDQIRDVDFSKFKGTFNWLDTLRRQRNRWVEKCQPTLAEEDIFADDLGKKRLRYMYKLTEDGIKELDKMPQGLARVVATTTGGGGAAEAPLSTTTTGKKSVPGGGGVHSSGSSPTTVPNATPATKAVDEKVAASDGDISDDNRISVSKSPSGASSGGGGAKRKAPSTPDPSSSAGDAAATTLKKPRVGGKSAPQKGSAKRKERLGSGSSSTPSHDLGNDGSSNELPEPLENRKGAKKKQPSAKSIILNLIQSKKQTPTTFSEILVRLEEEESPRTNPDTGKNADTRTNLRRRARDNLGKLKDSNEIVDIDDTKIWTEKRFILRSVWICKKKPEGSPGPAVSPKGSLGPAVSPPLKVKE
jgi:hypothetical protein